MASVNVATMLFSNINDKGLNNPNGTRKTDTTVMM